MEEEKKKQEEPDHLNEKYPDTPFYKPRYRKPHETDEEYEQFLKEYYDKTIDRKLNEKMAGREVYKPRDRRPYETDKEYEDFLKKYYEENVTPIPKMAFKKDNKHKVVSTKENLKHKLMRKFLIIATWTTIGLSALFNIKNITDKTHKVDTNKDNNKRIEHIDENHKIKLLKMIREAISLNGICISDNVKIEIINNHLSMDDVQYLITNYPSENIGVKEAIIKIAESEDPCFLHGYMSNSGFEDVREKIAENINKKSE